jgi:Carboxypeptidase regulatory-like domain
MSTTVRNSVGGSCIAVVLVLLFFAGNVLAADLIGVVRSDGGPGARVLVTLQQAGRDVVGKAKSDDAGRYVIRNVPPGEYDMTCGKESPVRVRINDGLNQINCRG